MIDFEKWLYKTIVEEQLVTHSDAERALEYQKSCAMEGNNTPLSIVLVKLSLLRYQQVYDLTLKYREYEKQKSQTGNIMFGRYEVKKEIGRGSSGEVFLVRDLEMQKNVALKILHNKNDINIARFHREARMIAKLTHPNIVDVYNVGEEKGISYLAMEYVPGKTLVDILATTGAIKVRKATHIIKKLADVLNFAHSNNILHRDVKPANIILKDEEPILTDFGLAREMGKEGALSKSGMIAGTPGYMAPEQVYGKNDLLDGRCDIFALGVTYYEMITGHKAFYDKHAVRILMKVIKDEPPLPSFVNPSIPDYCEKICLKAMKKKKEERYQTTLEMLQDIEKSLKRLRQRTTGVIQM